MRIAVLAGGLSPERDVSLSSGTLIANALISRGHSVALCDVYEGVTLTVPAEKMFGTKPFPPAPIAEREPDLEALKARCKNGDALIGRGVIELCRAADLAFVALHGAMGENGQLQAALDCYGVKYTGTGYAGSLLAMDKDLTKRLLAGSGVMTAPWVTLDNSALVYTSSSSKIEAEIGYPCVVKPTGCGSSVGVSIVRQRSELESALSSAAFYGGGVIVEKFIAGREFSVGVLAGVGLPPIEIIPKQGFYDYKNKYQAGLTTEICPAELSCEQDAEVRTAAVTVHKTLRLGSYSRVDFILDAETGKFVCLEANNLPGMTPISLLPQEAAAAGIEYPELCERIAFAAVASAEK
jgi:D-alanine--D-alanine ligase